jgi:predicted porin
MKRIPRSRSLKTLLLLTSAALLSAARARADMILYDKDGWTLTHSGLAQGFYSLSMGDALVKGGTAPPHAVGWGGWDNPGADADGNFSSSRFRSGWTGSRFDWVATKTVSENTSVSAMLGVAFAISTDNGPTRTNNNWDVRNAFIKIANKNWGELYIGRHVGLYTLGSIISTANITSAALGFGNGCVTGGDGLTCYLTGYGVKFPGFWSGVQYQTPDLAGLRIKVAVLDPETAGADAAPLSVPYTRRPLPMFQTLARYEGDFGTFQLIPYFNGFMQTVGQVGTNDTLTPWGAGGGLDVHVAGLRVGVGGSFENGAGFYGPLYSGAAVIDGAGELREGSAFFAHARYTFGDVVDVSGGYGQANINRTSNDELNNLNVEEMQSNIHAAVQYHWDTSLTFVAELNLLSHEWVAGNSQDVQVFTVGASFTY